MKTKPIYWIEWMNNDFEEKRQMGRVALDFIKNYGFIVESMQEDWKNVVEFETNIQRLEKGWEEKGKKTLFLNWKLVKRMTYKPISWIEWIMILKKKDK